MKNDRLKRKAFFRLPFPLAETLTAALLLLTFPACAAVADSARQQINNGVLKLAEQAVKAEAAQKQWADPHSRFNVFMPAAVASAAPCPQPPTFTASAKTLPRLGYSVLCPGAAGWRFTVTVKADIYLPVVMPARAIERGETLSADALVLKKFNISNQRGELVMKMEDVVGLTARHALRAYAPVKVNDVDRPLWVKRDQEVTLVSRSGEISAQTSGLALKNGRQGEVIKVQNASSQRVVSATVEAPGVVVTTVAQ